MLNSKHIEIAARELLIHRRRDEGKGRGRNKQVDTQWNPMSRRSGQNPDSQMRRKGNEEK